MMLSFLQGLILARYAFCGGNCPLAHFNSVLPPTLLHYY